MQDQKGRTSNWQKLKADKTDQHIFHQRAQIIHEIRSYFIEKGFLEIEVPLITPFPTLDSNIFSIETYISNNSGKKKKFYLHTSPEHSMKKILAAGAKKIFFLGKVFRNSEITDLHNPEFTMLEWYRTNATYKDVQKDTEELIYNISNILFSSKYLNYKNHKIDLSLPWKRISIQELFLNKTGIDISANQSRENFKKAAEKINIHIEPDDTWETIFYRIFLDKIEPELALTKPVFLTDYPARMALMAKIKKTDPAYSERVELFIGGLELANGYSELLNSEEQEKRFKNEQKKKLKVQKKQYPLDHELISALKTNILPSAGIALGIDRLIMLFLNKTRINDVLLFPMDQWF